MSIGLPEGLSPDDEIEVTWERDDISTKVTVNLGEVTITVETTEASAPLVPLLVAAMPNILEAAWDAIDEGDNQEES